MRWIHNYQLFLFDFDGILVNTETLHFTAYQRLCARRGFSLPWDMKTYLAHAMFNATALKEGIYRMFPDLEKSEPNWEVLYSEKKALYAQLLEERVELIEGIASLLLALDDAKITRCVVTHSPQEHLAIIRKQHPILDTIPYWITREQYSEPKPSSECYEKAMQLYHKPQGRVIGFEDSPRGLEALSKVNAEPVLITPFFDDNEIASLRKKIGKPFLHHSSFPSFFTHKSLP